MRYSLLAGGKRIRPVLALATARAIGREPGERAAARRRDRADPHLLADPRRPAGDGRRRPAPRPARPATSSSARTSRSSPATASTPRPSATCSPSRRATPERVARSGARAGRRDRRRRHGRRPVHRRRRASGDAPEELRRLHELKTGRLIGASVVCVLLLAGMDEAQTAALAALSRRELGVLFQIVDDILDVTGTDAALGKPQRQRRAARQAHLRHRVRAGRRARACRRVPSRRARVAAGGRAGRRAASSSTSPTSSSRAALA